MTSGHNGHFANTRNNRIVEELSVCLEPGWADSFLSCRGKTARRWPLPRPAAVEPESFTGWEAGSGRRALGRRALGEAGDMAEHAAEKRELRRQQLEERDKMGGGDAAAAVNDDDTLRWKKEDKGAILGGRSPLEPPD